MLPTLSQRWEVSFTEKGQRIQRKDDLTTYIQKKLRDILMINVPSLLFMSLKLLRTFAKPQIQAYIKFLKPDKCFSLFLVCSEF